MLYEAQVRSNQGQRKLRRCLPNNYNKEIRNLCLSKTSGCFYQTTCQNFPNLSKKKV